ncbi:ATP-binding protein [Atlantibacter sp.]|uniref:sensor histidine kinase n=1 Tax=Atlantibacter sp. TaxID=1903473 RepID=UPI0028AA6A03|nr:ATP-binding protein [Atlantibacter sp.]
MRNLSLSQRLTLIFITLLLLCAMLICWMQLRSNTQYGNTMVQQLSANLASQIVAREKLMDEQGEINREGLKGLFDRLMTLNPSVELYLLSTDGRLLADAAPVGRIKRQSVEMTPLLAYLDGQDFPLYGDDPRSSNLQKVFSVAPIQHNGRTVGYLYIILQGEKLNSLAQQAWNNTLWQVIVWTLILVTALGLLAGALVYLWVTRPVRQLTQLVRTLEQDSITAIKAIAQLDPQREQGNELILLRNTFIELSRQISSQWDRLANSDRQRREFIANISHDLRTPLTSLLGYLETLSLKAGSLTEEEARSWLQIALRQGNKVRRLSQQLFELARLEHGGIKPQREPFSAAELAQDVMQKFELMAETRQITLRLDVPPKLPAVDADVSMIERVFTNLLDNALRHTPAGGEVTLRLWNAHRQIEVEVEDNGEGIPESLQTQLFVRPSALTSEQSRQDRGGLGLMIVHRMLQLHHCDIRLIDKTPGACFRFSLPLAG